MKLDALPKPKTVKRPPESAKDEKPAKKARKRAVRKSSPKQPATAKVTEPNLHQKERNAKRKKEFTLPEEVVRDFEVVASTRGYGPRKHSDFFMEVWQFWQSNHTS